MALRPSRAPRSVPPQIEVLEDRVVPVVDPMLLADIRPFGDFALTDIGSLTVSGGVVYFVANDGTHGLELWKSDGTINGTVLVKDIRPSTKRFSRP